MNFKEMRLKLYSINLSIEWCNFNFVSLEFKLKHLFNNFFN